MKYNAVIAPEFGMLEPKREEIKIKSSINPKFPIRIKKGGDLRMWDYAYRALDLNKYKDTYEQYHGKGTIPYYDLINWKILDMLCFSAGNKPDTNLINETYVLLKSRKQLVIVNIKEIYQ